MSMVRVKHDPGYYLLAMHFNFKNARTGEEKTFETDKGPSGTVEGVWSEFALLTNFHERIIGYEALINSASVLVGLRLITKSF